MKKKLILTAALAALVAIPASVRADDDKDVKVDVKDKVTAANQKTHEKICQGNHGTVTAKTDNSLTIDGKQYAFTADTRVNKQEEPLLPKTVNVGDTVCFRTQKAADGTAQISQLIAIPKDTEKVRVREKDDGSPSKVEVETPDKKIEVK